MTPRTTNPGAPPATLTVSTLGAPGEGLDTVLPLLAAHRINGVELRLSLGEISSPAMTKQERSAVRARLADAGVRVTALASYIRIADPGTSDDMVVGALASALTLAADLEAPAVRVFPGAPTLGNSYRRVPATTAPRPECDAAAVRRLDAVSGLTQELGVHPVLETHDSHPRGEDVARILAQVKGKVGAVWDLMHPWRVGESLETTWQNLSPWLLDGLGSVQIKDAHLPESRTPVPIGEGTLPVGDFADFLRLNGYDGLVCLEWEKAWHPTAPPLDAGLASMRLWYEEHWNHTPEPGETRKHEQLRIAETQ